MSNSAPMNRRRFLGAVVAGTATGALLGTAPALATGRTAGSGAGRAAARPLYLGTYTSVDGGGTGIGLATYDEATGKITSTGVLTGVDDPSYLAISPSGKRLYAVDEKSPGAVTAVALDGADGPKVINSQPTGGDGPTHLSVHPDGGYLFSANYNSGSVSVHPIDSSGALGERTDLVAHSDPAPGPGQDGPHAHQIVTSPDGGHVLAVDLGNDTVYSYAFDTATGKLDQVSYATLKPGAGPRHLTFHPSGSHAYLANELDNTVVVCGYDAASGKLTPGTPQSTGTGEETSYPAELAVTSDGTFAYLANRGHDSITRYAIEADGAELRLLDTVPVGGNYPRQIALSPGGGLLFAANQKSSTVTVFTVDASSGGLTAVGDPFAYPVAVCALPL